MPNGVAMVAGTHLARLRSGFARKTVVLWGLLLVQAATAAYFLADIITDLLGIELKVGRVDHNGFELVVALALVFGTVLTGLQIRGMTRRAEKVEAQLKAASGAFIELLEESFDNWALTPSERDVALLAIKGLSIAEIADIRHTKDGTIKAQCNAIYRKAGVTGRPQLLSIFIEELMGAELVGSAMAERP